MYKESNKLLSVNHIDVLVKPGSEARFEPELFETDSYRGLQEQWENRFQTLEQMPHAVLLYFSEWRGVGVGRSWEKTRRAWEEVEGARVARLREGLESRVLFFETTDVPYDYEVLGALGEAGFVWDPETTTVWAYGEHVGEGRDYCVGVWGKIVKRILGVTDENFRYPVEELSMSYKLAKRIAEEQKTRAVKRFWVFRW